MSKIKQPDSDLSTEDKIKEAARKVFTRKGYAAARTRDIADEAGINLALLNYYFRSKEKLFDVIMLEKMQQLFGVMYPIVSNEKLPLEKKIEMIVENYINMLLENPDLPLFVLNEIRNPSTAFKNNFPINKIIQNTSLVNQIKEKRPDLNPIHFLLNILGMTIFPFIAKPIFGHIGLINEKDFNSLVNERKALIPIWVKAMLKAK
jgi:AcrR family transcriptional regulator